MADLHSLSDDGRALAVEVLRAFQPPPEITVSEWAEAERIIPQGNAEPGRWSNARVPYAVEPMDALNDDTVHTIIIAGAAQSSKTAIGENIVGWTATHDPCTILWAGPNDAASETASTRFDTIIAATPVLAERFGTRTARSRINNVGLKTYDGGRLVFVSAGSPSSLASHPARIVIADEVDRFPTSLRKEGDPIGLLRARGTTFARRKFVALSSPTQEGASRIEALYEEGDRREWHWRCECTADHVPQWEHVTWTPGDPLSARYAMPCCGLVLEDGQRWQAMQRGRWIATGEGRPGVRSYRFRGLSSPWIKMDELVAEYEAAKGQPSRQAPWFNTRLGLPFAADVGDGLDAATLQELAEPFHTHVCPDRAALLVGAIDVQGGWIASSVVAFGDADECWLLRFDQTDGDIKDPATRERIEALMAQKFQHPSGAVLDIEVVAIDSGYETQHVMEWSMKQRALGRKWYAVKGQAGPGRPIWTRGGDVSRSLGKLFIVGTDQAKDQIAAGMAMTEAGPAKVHIPRDMPAHVYEWLTNEEVVTKDIGGVAKREWRVKRGQRRNEPFDLLVYSLAVRHSADFGIPVRLARLAATGSIRAPQPSMADLAKRMAAVSAPSP
jgi:phage terminase large subunit GpA-like protein